MEFVVNVYEPECHDHLQYPLHYAYSSCFGDIRVLCSSFQKAVAAYDIERRTKSAQYHFQRLLSLRI